MMRRGRAYRVLRSSRLLAWRYMGLPSTCEDSDGDNDDGDHAKRCQVMIGRPKQFLGLHIHLRRTAFSMPARVALAGVRQAGRKLELGGRTTAAWIVAEKAKRRVWPQWRGGRDTDRGKCRRVGLGNRSVGHAPPRVHTLGPGDRQLRVRSSANRNDCFTAAARRRASGVIAAHRHAVRQRDGEYEAELQDHAANHRPSIWSPLLATAQFLSVANATYLSAERDRDHWPTSLGASTRSEMALKCYLLVLLADSHDPRDCLSSTCG